MLIGIISDTHDDMEQVKKAVELFNDRGVAHVIHAGDHCSPFVFEVMGGLKCLYTGIFGNNDGDRVLLKEKSGDRIFIQPHIFTISERSFAVVHEPMAVDAMTKSGKFDVVVYGHSHRPDIRKEGNTLIVNPGKAARLHKGKSTVAILQMDTMEAELIEL